MGDAKMPNRFSQLLGNSNNNRDMGRTVETHRVSSPVRKNRPRINNEVQTHDKDIAQYLQRM